MVTLTNAMREKIFFRISAVHSGVRGYIEATPLVGNMTSLKKA